MLSWVDARYEVSDTGLVRSWCSRSGGVARTAKVLSQKVTRDGYLRVTLTVAGKAKHFSVHRLVLTAFCGASSLQANHKNGDRGDNCLQNLEWCTASQNVTHAFAVLGKKHSRPNKGRFGKLHWNSKKVRQIDARGRTVRVWDAVSEAGRQGFSASCIFAVCAGRRKAHKGFVWAFENQT